MVSEPSPESTAKNEQQSSGSLYVGQQQSSKIVCCNMQKSAAVSLVVDAISGVIRGMRARLRVFLSVPQLAQRAPLPSYCREVWAAPASSFSSSHTQNSNSLFFNSLRSRGLGGSLDVATVLDFVDSGHDLILAADVGASDRIRDIATECEADFDEAAVLLRGVGHSLNAANSHILKVLTASPSAYSANPNTKLSSPPTLTGSAISLVYIVQAIKRPLKELTLLYSFLLETYF
ncbi:Dolichyl-diphosphooligosaccharide--protein glycosyltransferase subunit [Nymphaea thermarum]|nr:Dolichyl-diphosphooligosaccharide--protein glycosyltransferase subunit [Nymphaea thermarum]